MSRVEEAEGFFLKAEKTGGVLGVPRPVFPELGKPSGVASDECALQYTD